MLLTREQILHAAMELDPDERESLADQLLRSLDTSSPDPIESAWIAEAERRLDAVEAGTVELIPGPQVMRELRGRAHP